MFIIYVVGVPSIYITLFVRSQHELSLFEEITVKKLVCGDNKLAELAKVKAFYTSDVTIGHAPDIKMATMFQHAFITEVSSNSAESDDIASLERYYAKREERWEKLCNEHYLSFLFGAYEGVPHSLRINPSPTTCTPQSFYPGAASFSIHSHSCRALLLVRSVRSLPAHRAQWRARVVR